MQIFNRNKADGRMDDLPYGKISLCRTRLLSVNLYTLKSLAFSFLYLPFPKKICGCLSVFMTLHENELPLPLEVSFSRY